MNLKTVHSILATCLGLMGETVSWTGQEFKKPNGAYLRETFLPAETVAISLGSGAAERNVGFYQVDAYYPEGSGWGDVEDLADDVIEQFYRGLRLSSGTVHVTIEASYWGTPGQGAGHLQIPVLIEYRAEDYGG